MAEPAPPPPYDPMKGGPQLTQPGQPIAGYTTTTVFVDQQPGVPQQIVYVQPAIHFDKFPVQVQCSSCQQTITTLVEPKAGMLPWLVCGGLTLVGCWLGCCLIPFCIDDLKDHHHHCPNCHALVGVHRRLD